MERVLGASVLSRDDDDVTFPFRYGLMCNYCMYSYNYQIRKTIKNNNKKLIDIRDSNGNGNTELASCVVKPLYRRLCCFEMK